MSEFTEVGGTLSSVGQSVGCIASGGASLSLLRMQIIGESIQLLRYIEVGWPPSVNEYFAISDTDPGSVSLPIEITIPVDTPLEEVNYTMPRVFETYELPPFLFANYTAELTNILLYIIATLAYFILFKIIHMKSTKQKNFAKPSAKTKLKKPGVLAAAFRKIVASLKKLDHFTMRNYLLIYLCSIFEPGVMFSLLNFKYYSSSSDAAASGLTTASLVVSAVIFPIYMLLLVFIIWKVITCVKYVLGKDEDDPKPPGVAEWPFLFEELATARILQLYHLPISMIRGLLMGLIISLLTSHPIAQIVLVWVISFFFVLYYIFFKPLKAKWERRFTLAAEIGLLVCATLGIVVAAIQQNREIDPDTSNQIGFVFIAVAIFSASMGILITILKVLEMAVDAYQFVKEWRNRKKDRRVHPIVENIATHEQEDVTQTRITFPKSPLQTIKLKNYIPKVNALTPRAAVNDVISQNVEMFLKKVGRDVPQSDFATSSLGASLKDDLVKMISEYYDTTRREGETPISTPHGKRMQMAVYDFERESPSIQISKNLDK